LLQLLDKYVNPTILYIHLKLNTINPPTILCIIFIYDLFIYDLFIYDLFIYDLFIYDLFIYDLFIYDLFKVV
jgi:hypothetical protein